MLFTPSYLEIIDGMSKAFTKETDNEEDDPELGASASPLPPGGKNYITPKGVEKLRRELKYLLDDERPKVVEKVTWAASLGDRSENADYIYGKRRLRQIDSRIRFLSKRLEGVEIIDPANRPPSDKIFFGATVTTVDTSGEERVFKIVGVDEIDASQGKISWLSPIGKALIKHTVGDSITIESPKGKLEFEVLKVEYIEI